MSLSYSDTVATIALLISVIGTFLSGYLSYHYALRGEKRKEYNAAADKVTLALMEQRLSALSGKYPANTLTPNHLDPLLIVCPKKQRVKMNIAIQNYNIALHNSGGWVSGVYDFHSPEILIKAIDDLLKCCARK